MAPANLVQESDLTRLVRELLRQFKAGILENTNITVAVDYDDTTADGLDIVAIATLPSLVLSGPRLLENRFFATNEPVELLVTDSYAKQWDQFGPVHTVDLGFTITGASRSTVELLNLMAATVSFLNLNRWLELDRDPNHPDAGTVRFEMDPEGEVRTHLDGGDGVRAFTCGLVVRGFDIDEGTLLGRTTRVDEMRLSADGR
jgi:hypothetical protein